MGSEGCTSRAIGRAQNAPHQPGTVDLLRAQTAAKCDRAVSRERKIFAQTGATSGKAKTPKLGSKNGGPM